MLAKSSAKIVLFSLIAIIVSTMCVLGYKPDLAAPQAAQAQGCYITDDFSSGDYSGGSNWVGNWTEIDDDNNSSSGSVLIDSGRLAFYGQNTQAFYESISREFSPLITDTVLSFAYDDVAGIGQLDNFYLDVSSDGINYTRVYTIRPYYTSAQTFTITLPTGTSSIKFVIGMSSSSEIVYIDDVEIQVDCPAPTDTPTATFTPTPNPLIYASGGGARSGIPNDILDNDNNTCWYFDGSIANPSYVIFDLGEVKSIDQFYVTSPVGETAGIQHAIFSASSPPVYFNDVGDHSSYSYGNFLFASFDGTGDYRTSALAATGETGRFILIYSNNNDNAVCEVTLSTSALPTATPTNTATATPTPDASCYITDDFQTSGYAGGSGWSGDWVEVGDDGNSSTGYIADYAKIIGFYSPPDTTSISRSFPSLIEDTTMFFRYWDSGTYNEPEDKFHVYYSVNGVDYTLLHTFEPFTDTDHIHQFTLPAGSMAIKFAPENLSGANENIYIDNLEIQVPCAPTPTPTSTPPVERTCTLVDNPDFWYGDTQNSTANNWNGTYSSWDDSGTKAINLYDTANAQQYLSTPLNQNTNYTLTLDINNVVVSGSITAAFDTNGGSTDVVISEAGTYSTTFNSGAPTVWDFILSSNGFNGGLDYVCLEGAAAPTPIPTETATPANTPTPNGGGDDGSGDPTPPAPPGGSTPTPLPTGEWQPRFDPDTQCLEVISATNPSLYSIDGNGVSLPYTFTLQTPIDAISNTWDVIFAGVQPQGEQAWFALALEMYATDTYPDYCSVSNPYTLRGEWDYNGIRPYYACERSDFQTAKLVRGDTYSGTLEIDGLLACKRSGVTGTVTATPTPTMTVTATPTATVTPSPTVTPCGTISETLTYYYPTGQTAIFTGTRIEGAGQEALGPPESPDNNNCLPFEKTQGVPLCPEYWTPALNASPSYHEIMFDNQVFVHDDSTIRTYSVSGDGNSAIDYKALYTDTWISLGAASNQSSNGDWVWYATFPYEGYVKGVRARFGPIDWYIDAYRISNVDVFTDTCTGDPSSACNTLDDHEFETGAPWVLGGTNPPTISGGALHIPPEAPDGSYATARQYLSSTTTISMNTEYIVRFEVISGSGELYFYSRLPPGGTGVKEDRFVVPGPGIYTTTYNTRNLNGDPDNPFIEIAGDGFNQVQTAFIGSIDWICIGESETECLTINDHEFETGSAWNLAGSPPATIQNEALSLGSSSSAFQFLTYLDLLTFTDYAISFEVLTGTGGIHFVTTANDLYVGNYTITNSFTITGPGVYTASFNTYDLDGVAGEYSSFISIRSYGFEGLIDWVCIVDDSRECATLSDPDFTSGSPWGASVSGSTLSLSQSGVSQSITATQVASIDLDIANTSDLTFTLSYNSNPVWTGNLSVNGNVEQTLPLTAPVLVDELSISGTGELDYICLLEGESTCSTVQDAGFDTGIGWDTDGTIAGSTLSLVGSQTATQTVPSIAAAEITVDFAAASNINILLVDGNDLKHTISASSSGPETQVITVSTTMIDTLLVGGDGELDFICLGEGEFSEYCEIHSTTGNLGVLDGVGETVDDVIWREIEMAKPVNLSDFSLYIATTIVHSLTIQGFVSDGILDDYYDDLGTVLVGPQIIQFGSTGGGTYSKFRVRCPDCDVHETLILDVFFAGSDIPNACIFSHYDGDGNGCLAPRNGDFVDDSEWEWQTNSWPSAPSSYWEDGYAVLKTDWDFWGNRKPTSFSQTVTMPSNTKTGQYAILGFDAKSGNNTYGNGILEIIVGSTVYSVSLTAGWLHYELDISQYVNQGQSFSLKFTNPVESEEYIYIDNVCIRWSDSPPNNDDGYEGGVCGNCEETLRSIFGSWYETVDYLGFLYITKPIICYLEPRWLWLKCLLTAWRNEISLESTVSQEQKIMAGTLVASALYSKETMSFSVLNSTSQLAAEASTGVRLGTLSTAAPVEIDAAIAAGTIEESFAMRIGARLGTAIGAVALIAAVIMPVWDYVTLHAAPWLGNMVGDYTFSAANDFYVPGVKHSTGVVNARATDMMNLVGNTGNAILESLGSIVGSLNGLVSLIAIGYFLKNIIYLLGYPLGFIANIANSINLGNILMFGLMMLLAGIVATAAQDLVTAIGNGTIDITDLLGSTVNTLYQLGYILHPMPLLSYIASSFGFDLGNILNALGLTLQAPTVQQQGLKAWLNSLLDMLLNTLSGLSVQQLFPILEALTQLLNLMQSLLTNLFTMSWLLTDRFFEAFKLPFFAFNAFLLGISTGFEASGESFLPQCTAPPDPWCAFYAAVSLTNAAASQTFILPIIFFFMVIATARVLYANMEELWKATFGKK